MSTGRKGCRAAGVGALAAIATVAVWGALSQPIYVEGAGPETLRLDPYRDAVGSAINWAFGIALGVFGGTHVLWLVFREGWRPATGTGSRRASVSGAISGAMALAAILLGLVFRTGISPIGQIDMASGSFEVLPVNAARWAAATIAALALAGISASAVFDEYVEGSSVGVVLLVPAIAVGAGWIGW